MYESSMREFLPIMELFNKGIGLFLGTSLGLDEVSEAWRVADL